LGAQKVVKSFAEIESEAMQRDKDRDAMNSAMRLQEAKTKEDEAKRM
jgi:hypothetical protein